jgi:hypothetical protein
VVTGGEVHWFVWGRDTDVRYVAEDVAGGDVQRPTEGDREMGEVTTHSLAGSVGVRGAGPRIGRAGYELEVTMDEIHHRLHSPPARLNPAEPLPSFMA